jgi:hypothetical protein
MAEERADRSSRPPTVQSGELDERKRFLQEMAASIHVLVD